MAIEAVVFDIGNVLVGWQPERFYDRVTGPARRKALFAAVDLDGMNLRVDGGAPWRETVAAVAEAHPDWAAEVQLWHDRWDEMFSPVIDHSVRTLRALRGRGVPVLALTNFGRETFAFAKGRHDFLNEFDRVFASGHLGLLKPDPAIYAVVEAAGHAPEALLFADDRADNIAAAAARGWHTHHFTDPAGWARRLVAEGLLTEQEAGL